MALVIASVAATDRLSLSYIPFSLPRLVPNEPFTCDGATITINARRLSVSQKLSNFAHWKTTAKIAVASTVATLR